MQQSGGGSASFIGLVLRGLAMGIAELVPGVSGGTIAFMTGIYLQLVRTLASFGVDSIAMIGRPKQFWQHHNLSFLLSLGLGMGFGIVIFAQVIRYSLANFPPVIWAFFFGVISASIIHMARQRSTSALLYYALPGVVLGGRVCGATCWRFFRVTTNDFDRRGVGNLRLDITGHFRQFCPLAAGSI